MDASSIRSDDAMSSLTRRQRECMECVKGGMSAKEIARDLGISHRTVEQHVAAAMLKMGVTTRYEAIAYMFEVEAEERDSSAFLLDHSAGEGSDGYLVESAPPDSAPTEHRDTGDTDPQGKRRERFFPPLGGMPNASSVQDRKRWIFRIGGAAATLTCALIIFILGLSEMASSVAAAA